MRGEKFYHEPHEHHELILRNLVAVRDGSCGSWLIFLGNIFLKNTLISKNTIQHFNTAV